MSENLKPIQARVDPEETGLIPLPVLEALTAAVGASRDLLKTGHECLTGDCRKCERCLMSQAIDHLDETMALWERGELFTLRQPQHTGDSE